MNSSPAFELDSSSEEETQLIEGGEDVCRERRDEFSSEAQEDKEDVNKEEEQAPGNVRKAILSKANSQNTLENTTSKVLNQHTRLTDKKQMMQVKRDARFKDVMNLHKEIMDKWNEITKCQHDYNNQYLRWIETSTAVWQAKANSNHKYRSPSHGSSGPNRAERCPTEKEARDLLETIKKRLKTLEEENILLTRNLEDAKFECQILDEELVDIITIVGETKDILDTLNGDTENNSGTFISRGSSIDGMPSLRSNDFNNPQKECNGKREVREEYVVEKRSFRAHSPCTNSEERRKSNLKIGSSSTNTDSQSASQRKDIHFSSNTDESQDENPSRPLKSSSSKYKYVYICETNSKQSSAPLCTPVSLQSVRKKPGRPKKQPEIARMSKDTTVKRKRGRPRKYLKLELAPTASDV